MPDAEVAARPEYHLPVPDDQELRLEVKTTAAVVDRLIAHIREQHSYDVQATPVT